LEVKVSSGEGAVEEILPRIRCGSYYPDKWTTPYLGVDFALPAGQPILEFTVYNPRYAVYDGASLLVRLSLVPLYRSGQMQPGSYERVALELPPCGAGAIIALSFRSSVKWSPLGSDKRILGLILPSLRCSVMVHGTAQRLGRASI
jgi:hypothetical protein